MKYTIHLDKEILNELEPVSEDPVRDLADYFYETAGELYEGNDWGGDSESTWDEAKDFARDIVMACLKNTKKALTFTHHEFGTVSVHIRKIKR